MMNIEITRLAEWSCGGIRTHSSGDILESFSGKTGIIDLTKCLFLFWSSVAYDFPFLCLYINVQTLDLERVEESALCLVIAQGVC